MRVHTADIQPASPAHSAAPHSTKLVIKPLRPSAIIALRPRLSERRAQNGAHTTHRSADHE